MSFGDGPQHFALVRTHRVRRADLAKGPPSLGICISSELLGNLIHGHLRDLRWIRSLQVVEILEVSAGHDDVHAGPGRDGSQLLERGFLAASSGGVHDATQSLLTGRPQLIDQADPGAETEHADRLTTAESR